METSIRRLTRSRTDRWLGGVCGGLAHFLGWDATLVRISYAVLTLLLGIVGGLILYFLAWMLMPLADAGAVAAATPGTVTRRLTGRTAAGAILLVVGALGLLGSFSILIFHWPVWLVLGPVVLLAVGLGLVLSDRDESYVPTRTVIPSSPVEPNAGSAAGASATPAPRLVRIRRGRRIAGVSTGLGGYLGVDPTIIRLLSIILVLFWGVGVLLYLILWIVMPLED